MTPFPLVMIPALASDERLWAPVVERLDDSVPTHIILGEGVSIEAIAANICTKAPAEFCLAGISMGGYVALEIALNAPERVRGLALLNTSALAADEARRANSIQAIAAVEAGQFEATARRIAGAVAPELPDITELAEAMALDLGPHSFRQQQQAIADRRDRRAEVGSITVPTLIIGGAQDRIVPLGLSEELAGLIPTAELVELEGVGHLSTVEDPDRVASAMSSWLRRVNEHYEVQSRMSRGSDHH